MPDPILLAALQTTKEGIDVLDKLGALDRVILKLKSNPDKAAGRLNQALGELKLGYTALHNEMVALGGLSWEPEDLAETRDRLRALRSGQLKVELARMKGSCTLINNIYQRYLRGWFDRVLTSAESTSLENLFMDLATMDGRFIGSADALSDVAQHHATEALRLLDAGDMAGAAILTLELDARLVPMIGQLSSHMARMWEMQAEFMGISGAV